MANKIRVKLILELRSAGMSRNLIASTRRISRNSVSDVFRIADAKGITHADIENLSDQEVYRMFYPDKYVVENMYRNPDYEYVHKELKKVGVTLKLLWNEYKDTCRTENAIPMGYTKFCEGYGDHTISNKLTNHLQHKPGIATEVDWSGPTMSYVDQGYRRSDYCLLVCSDATLQPVFLCGTLSGYETGYLATMPYPYV
ncbi:MAG: hypothetical protein ACOX57_09465 [Limnochordia bacterium]